MIDSPNPDTFAATANDAVVGFRSLAALRAAHNDLLKRYRERGDAPALLDKAEAFIRQGQLTGGLLDAEHDRWEAQSLLDYWATVLYRAGHEASDATLADFDPQRAPELSDADCPYVGLDAFREAQHDLFFGRKRLEEQMADRLKQSRLLAVVGPPGSGKSSLVMAGLLPALKAGAVPGSQDWRYLSPMVPGSNPLANLARRLRPAGLNPAEWEQGRIESFQKDSSHLSRLIGTLQRPTVLIIDQFEELFTLCLDATVRRAFIDDLVGLIQMPEVGHTIILTMRTGFKPDLKPLKAFYSLLEPAQVDVPPLTADELREAIEGPAALKGLKFEEGIVDALIRDILGEPAGLPLLQFTLAKLWEHRKRNRITWEACLRLGVGRHALARSADELYDQLIPQDRLTVKRILLQMVQPSEGPEVAMKRIRFEMLFQGGEPPYWTNRVLERLIQARLVRLTKGDTPSDDQIEIVHEALAYNWARLKDWLEDERATLLRRGRLTAAAEQWKAHNRDPGVLWQGSSLDEALRYQNLNELETEFVQASQAAVQQAEREKEAARQRELELKLAFALVSQLAAQSLTLHEKYPQRSLLLALEALNVTSRVGEPRLPVAEDALRRALANSGGRGLRGHRGAVSVAAVTRDSRWLVTGSADRTARLWDLTAPDPAASPIVLRGHQKGITAMAISPDNRWLVTGGDDSTARLWDLTAPDPAASPLVLRGHEGLSIRAVAISPNNDWLVIGGEDNTPCLWDLTNLAAAPILLPGHAWGIRAVAFSPDNCWLVTGSDDHTARLWDLTAPDPAASPIVLEHEDAVWNVAITPDSRWLVTGSVDRTARLWDLAAPDPAASPLVLRGHEKGITAMAISPDNRWLVTGSWDKTARLWDLTHPSRPSIVLREHDDWVGAMAFSSDNRWLVTGSGDRSARLWDLTNLPAAPGVLRGHDDVVRAVAISPDNRWLVTGSDDHTVRVWDLTAPGLAAAPIVLHGGRKPVAISPDKRWLVTGGQDSTACLWDMNKPTAAAIILRGHEDVIWSVAFSPNGHWLATGSRDSTARLWDLTTPDPVASPIVLRGYAYGIHAMAVTPDSRWLVTGHDDSTVRLWDLTAPDPAAAPIILRGHRDWITAVAISPNNRWLVTGSGDRSARLWRLADLTVAPIVLRGHEKGITAAAISPDNRWLVTGGWDNTARLWDLTAPDPAAAPIILRGHRYAITSVTISPDNRWLVTGSEDRTARLWDLTASDPAASPLVLSGHEWGIRAMAISSDSHLLVTGSDDKTACLWDLTKPTTAPIVLCGHKDRIWAVAIGSDNHWLVTATDDAAYLWNLRLDELMKLACHTAGRNLTAREWNQYFPGQEYAKTCSDLSVPHSVIEEELAKAQSLARASDLQAASLAYKQAVQWVTETDDVDLNSSIGRHGSIDGFAETVMPVCERAIALEPDNGDHYDSRGLARALSGDYAGAIEDFRFYLTWGKDKRPEDLLLKRKVWIQELEAGRNPFDAATLESLRNE